MVKKYWLETLVGIAASCGLIGVMIYLNMTVFHLWWAANCWWVIGLLGLSTSRWWWPSVRDMGAQPWRIFITLVDFLRSRDEHELNINKGRAYLKMLETTANRMQEGHDVEYHNATTGDAMKVRNPLVALHIEMIKSGRAAPQTNIQVQAQQQDLLSPVYPEPQDFADVLQYWRPSRESVYMINTVKGPITMPLPKTYHIGLAAPTGAGKTNIFRLHLGQALFCGAKVHLANPNYAPVKMNEGSVEDWRPIASQVASGMVAWRLPDIMQLLDEGIAELENRRLRQQTNPSPQEDVYYAFGEWPAIYSMVLFTQGKREAERVAGQLGRLLRESRQYNMHVLTEFQDALVQTTGGNSGVREQYRTVYYAGGDPTTAKALLDLKNGESIDETGLGHMGASVLRCQSNPLVRGRVPFFSNRALYMLLGEPELILPDKVDQLTPELLQSITNGLLGSRFDEPAEASNDLSCYRNLMVVQGSRIGRQPEEPKPEHLAYASENRLSDKSLAQALQITQYQANKINNLVREQAVSVSVNE